MAFEGCSSQSSPGGSMRRYENRTKLLPVISHNKHSYVPKNMYFICGICSNITCRTSIYTSSATTPRVALSLSRNQSVVLGEEYLCVSHLLLHLAGRRQQLEPRHGLGSLLCLALSALHLQAQSLALGVGQDQASPAVPPHGRGLELEGGG